MSADNLSRVELAYVNIAYGIMILLALAIVAFSPAYFMVLDTPLPLVMHMHAALMFLWMIILIAQPILIKKKKYFLHRVIGRISYGLVPLLLFSAYGMIRYAYNTDFIDIPKAALKAMSYTEILQQARIYIALPFYYFFAFILFYILGIIYKRDVLVHAKYMIATALTVTGPIVDRVVYHALTAMHIDIIFPLEFVAFLLIDLVIIMLLYVDFKNKRNIQPALLILSLYVTGQFFYAFGLTSSVWQTLAGWLLVGAEG